MGRLVKLLSEHLMLACALAVALVVAHYLDGVHLGGDFFDLPLGAGAE